MRWGTALTVHQQRDQAQRSGQADQAQRSGQAERDYKAAVPSVTFEVSDLKRELERTRKSAADALNAAQQLRRDDKEKMVDELEKQLAAQAQNHADAAAQAQRVTVDKLMGVCLALETALSLQTALTQEAAATIQTLTNRAEAPDLCSRLREAEDEKACSESRIRELEAALFSTQHQVETTNSGAPSDSEAADKSQTELHAHNMEALQSKWEYAEQALEKSQREGHELKLQLSDSSTRCDAALAAHHELRVKFEDHLRECTNANAQGIKQVVKELVHGFVDSSQIYGEEMSSTSIPTINDI